MKLDNTEVSALDDKQLGERIESMATARGFRPKPKSLTLWTGIVRVLDEHGPLRVNQIIWYLARDREMLKALNMEHFGDRNAYWKVRRRVMRMIDLDILSPADVAFQHYGQ